MILIAGGTGTLGRELLPRLSASGRHVRVLTRHAAHAEGLDVDVAVGDVRDPSTLADAMRGVSAVVSAMHGFVGGRGAGPQAVDVRGNHNLIRAARNAGVEHFVLLSALGAAPDHPMSLHRAKYAAERELVASGLSWTILRPSAYIETWIEVVGGKLASGGPALVLGRAENTINFVSVRDVASLVDRAITDPALRNRTVDIPGLDNLTMTQLAHHLGAHRIRRIPRPGLRLLAVLLAPVAPAFARQASAAVVMDTTKMAANAASLCNRFPDVTWHSATAIADQFHAAHVGLTAKRPS